MKVFKEVFLINNAESSLVQTAFYGGYFTMALPAAFFIRKYSYKAAIMIGFALYAIGAFLSLPASLATATAASGLVPRTTQSRVRTCVAAVLLCSPGF